MHDLVVVMMVVVVLRVVGRVGCERELDCAGEAVDAVLAEGRLHGDLASPSALVVVVAAVGAVVNGELVVALGVRAVAVGNWTENSRGHGLRAGRRGAEAVVGDEPGAVAGVVLLAHQGLVEEVAAARQVARAEGRRAVRPVATAAADVPVAADLGDGEARDGEAGSPPLADGGVELCSVGDGQDLALLDDETARANLQKSQSGAANAVRRNQISGESFASALAEQLAVF